MESKAVLFFCGSYENDVETMWNVKCHLQPSTFLYLHYFRCRRNVQNWYNRNKQLNEEALTPKKTTENSPHDIYHLFFFGGDIFTSPQTMITIGHHLPPGSGGALPKASCLVFLRRDGRQLGGAWSRPGWSCGGWLPDEFVPFLEDHPMTCKWSITMVSKPPKRGYSPPKWPKWLINRGY